MEYRTMNLAVRERRRRDIHPWLIENVLSLVVASCALAAELSLAERVEIPTWEFSICYSHTEKSRAAAPRRLWDQLVPLLRWCSQSVLPLTMDGSLASTQQPHQLPASVGGVTHDSTSSAPPQRVPDHPTSVQTEEPSPKPELSSSEVVQTTADILQVLQKLQAQQSVSPSTPQTTSFTPNPEPQPQPQPQLQLQPQPQSQPQPQPQPQLQLQPRPQSHSPPVSVLPKEDPQPATSVVPGEPVTEWDALGTSLRETPHDTEGWNKLVRLAEDSGDLEKIKEGYESLLKMYPNTVRNLQSVVKHVLLT